MIVVKSDKPGKVYSTIIMCRFGDWDTKGLKTLFCINENLPTWQELKYFSLLMVSYCIWIYPIIQYTTMVKSKPVW